MAKNIGKRVGFRLSDETMITHIDISTVDQPGQTLAILEDGSAVELEDDEFIEGDVIVSRDSLKPGNPAEPLDAGWIQIGDAKGGALIYLTQEMLDDIKMTGGGFIDLVSRDLFGPCG